MKKTDGSAKTGIVDKVVYSVGRSVISGVIFYLACLILYAVFYHNLMPSTFLTMYGIFCLIGIALVLFRFHLSGYLFMLGAFLGLAADCYLSGGDVYQFGVINAFVLGAFSVLSIFTVMRRFKKKPQAKSGVTSSVSADSQADKAPATGSETSYEDN